jgi:hypothetical protein
LLTRRGLNPFGTSGRKPPPPAIATEGTAES